MQHPEVSEYLDVYLNNTRLSMGQVAKKWGVSTPLLSQIKNGKKRPGLELGLRILRESGASWEERKAWLQHREVEGHEVNKVFEDEKKDRIEFRIQKDLGETFENNPLLLDLFLDISFMRDKGLSWSGVLKNYGEYGLELVQILMDGGIVTKDGDRYVIVEDRYTHVINLENSIGVMKGVFETLKRKVQKEEFKGELHFDFTDVSPEGYKKLKELNVEYTKKMVAVIKENEMPRVKGGLRVISQNLISILRSFVFIFLIASLNGNTSFAQGNGLSGGGSGKFINGQDLTIKSLKKVLQTTYPSGRYPRNLRVRDGSEIINLEYKPAAYMTDYFANEADAVESVVHLNKVLESGQINKDDSRFLVRTLPTRCETHKISMRVKKELEGIYKQGTIKPLGFKVEQSYQADGTPRYHAVTNYMIPCVPLEND